MVCKIRSVRRRVASQGPQEGDEITLLGLAQLEVEEEVEELDAVLEGGQPAVVEVRRRVLDAPQREGLDPALGPAAVELLDAQVVHLVVQVERRRVARRAAGLAVEQ